MTESYIRAHFEKIKKYANAIENRLDDAGLNAEQLIDEEYQVDMEW